MIATAFVSVLVAAVVSVSLGSCGGTARTSATTSASTNTTTAPASSTTSEQPATPVYTSEIALFGDSLAWEAEPYYRSLIQATGNTALTSDTFGGIAICDTLDEMRTVAKKKVFGAVQIEFSGNSLTPCMSGSPYGTQAWLDKYRTDAITAVGIFAPLGTRVFLIGSPVTRSQWESQNPFANSINEIYAEIAASDPAHVTYVDAGAAVLSVYGGFTKTLACLLAEPCTGPAVDGIHSNVVRSPDGAHFCPDEEGDSKGVVGGCLVYSSGAYRYANAMVEALKVPIGPASTP
jgi:hypothetical protein